MIKTIKKLFEKDKTWTDKTSFSWTLVWRNMTRNWRLIISSITMPIVIMGFCFWGVKLIAPNISPEAYFTIIHYALYTVPLMFSLVGIALPLSLVTSDINSGAIGIELVSGFSRKKILLNKIYTLWIFLIIIFILQTCFGLLIFELEAPAGYAGKFINMNSCYWMGTVTLAFITFALTVKFKKKSKVNMIATFILTFSMVMTLVGEITGTDALTYISIYAYYRPSYILENSNLIAIGYCVGFAITFILSQYSLREFETRNLEI